MKNQTAKQGPSQTSSRAGAAAIFLTIFCIIWDSVVFGLMLKANHIPFWFKALFVSLGLLVTGLMLNQWWQRMTGGVAQLQLPQDPLPHGISHAIAFDFNRDITAHEYKVNLRIEARQRNSSSFGRVWEQDFPAKAIGSNHVRSNITLPADYPSSQSHQDGATYQIILSLHADKLQWDFNLETRPAQAQEHLAEPVTSQQLGTQIPQYSPEQIATIRKKWTRFAAVFAIVITAWQLHHIFRDFIPWSPLKNAQAAVLPGTYSTQTTTEPFDLVVTNYLMNDWALRGRLLGVAQVRDSELIVKVNQLDIRPMNKCDKQPSCDVKSVRLLLSQEGDKTFSTPAQSPELMINTHLAETGSWSLPADQQGQELRMTLPSSIEADSMRLKLEIRSQTNSTVYPEHGAYLNLHRALAKATGKADPCTRLSDRIALAQAGCTAQLERLISGVPGLWTQIKALSSNAMRAIKNLGAKIGLGEAESNAPDTLETLLIASIKAENSSTAAMLLRHDASANAQDLEHEGRSALGYAATANRLELMQDLFKAGANADLRLRNDKGQVITALTQALRSDPAQAVDLLLQKGASLKIDDPQGWTPMHIAAYESATQSIALMVKHGGNVNEKTPAYRQQTAFHTALQFGNPPTIRAMLDLGADLSATDNQGKNACDWAEFFKRSQEIRQWVCPAAVAAPAETPDSALTKP